MWRSGTDAGRIGAAEGISSRVIFADFSSRMPGKFFRKNSDSLSKSTFTPSMALAKALPAWSWLEPTGDVFTASFDVHPGAEF
ncbi:hypothetical protein EQU24_09315 [Methylotuvimicrobium buryatense]|uniref:Uncharacterized protein n=1 Tax=Methylotuvimicrobium buryatense TaxID=95641 RepID=A0A4V1IJS4_METBY|nr:hypothetical protein EQU24_09315 [Methylotuvimicrobium buryatense]